jgi:hypothetical protein
MVALHLEKGEVIASEIYRDFDFSMKRQNAEGRDGT